MHESEPNKSISRILSVGASAVTLVVVTGSVTDPINAPKLLALGCVAFGGLLVFLSKVNSFKTSFYTKFHLALIGFVAWALISSIVSGSPFTQNFYGVYGRNTGFLTYLLLSMIAFMASLIKTSNISKSIVFSFAFSGLVNLFYGYWVTLFGDFIGWNNQYGALLGTFGNPNFISAFLGIFFTVVITFWINAKWKQKSIVVLLLILIGFQLTKTESIQGIVLALMGALIVGLLWLRTKKGSRSIVLTCISIATPLGLVAAAGSFGIGPLSNLLSQQTLIYRLQYWFAGWQMGAAHPIFGVGMDSFGDWYRVSRGELALQVPGKNVVTNVAHNVTIDVFSYGGFPLLILYLIINIFALINIYKFINKSVTWNPFQVSVIAIWLTYHLQALISINQIGLAIWGWILTGILANPAFPNHGMSEYRDSPRNAKRVKTNRVPSEISMFLGIIVGILIAIPPMTADMAWASALKARELSKLENALAGGYFRPQNSVRLAEAVRILEGSNFPKIAVKYARLGIKFNSRNSDAWKMLYYASNSTEKEKKIAREALINLDPLNSEWKSLP